MCFNPYIMHNIRKDLPCELVMHIMSSHFLGMANWEAFCLGHFFLNS